MGSSIIDLLLVLLFNISLQIEEISKKKQRENKNGVALTVKYSYPDAFRTALQGDT